ncbi:MAG TPA: hypothetical protein VEQ61_10145 [Thermoleophilaceae bacterium]|nr:hypothetical protein [Thermoleophilaceae bacterium]
MTVKRFALLGLALTALAGCGSDDEKGEPIPAAQAAELQKQLDSVENRFEFGGGACGDIPDNERDVARAIEALPAEVDPDVRRALEDSFARLFELTAEQCDEQKGQETETETTPETETETTPETETETTPTETEPETETETTPTETQPETPTETQPEPAPGGDGGAEAPEGGE